MIECYNSANKSAAAMLETSSGVAQLSQRLRRTESDMPNDNTIINPPTKRPPGHPRLATVCKIEGCKGGPKISRGMCLYHYNQWHYYGGKVDPRPAHFHARKGRVTPEWKTWQRMKMRCFNSARPDYPRYGGRGITVCDRWLKFENFLSDMGLRPSPRHSLDRINNDGDYEPDNCRWATLREQANNKRNNVLLVLDGKALTVPAWGRLIGVNKNTLYARIRRGWPVERILTESARFGKNQYSAREY